MTIKAHRQYEIQNDAYHLWIRTFGHSSRGVALNVVETLNKAIEQIPPDLSRGIIPLIECDPLLQALMDLAWENGMRPTGFKDVLNETAALKKHLEDMRAILFAKLEVKAPC
jgi:hypothetical protein